MSAVTDLAALTYDNLNLRGLVIDGQIRENQLQLQILQANRRTVARELRDHVALMRADVDAGESDAYDPKTKAFVPKVAP